MWHLCEKWKACPFLWADVALRQGVRLGQWSMDWTSASTCSLSRLPLNGAQSTCQQPGQGAPELLPYSALYPPSSPLCPLGLAARGKTSDTSHPDRLQPPCRVPPDPQDGCTGLRRLQLLRPWPLPGRSLSAPIISPLGVAGEQRLPSVRVSRDRFASALCDLSCISVLSWARPRPWVKGREVSWSETSPFLYFN